MADDPTPQEKLAQQILSGGPVVSEATQAVGKLFQSTFAALSQDLEKVIQSNKSSDALTTAVNTLTSDMINLLRDRIQGVFTASAGAAPAAPAAAAQPEKPGDAP